MENKPITPVESITEAKLTDTASQNSFPPPTESRSKVSSIIVFSVISSIFAIIFYYLEYPLLILTFFVADKIGGGTSFMGLPVELLYAMNIVNLMKIFFIFPFLVFLNFIFFKILSNKFHFPKLNIFLKLIISAAFISFAFWYNPLIKRVEIATAPSKSEVAEKTSNISTWKKYENVKLGFSLEYPEYLKVKEIGNDGDKYVTFTPPGEEHPLFTVEIPEGFHPISAYESRLIEAHDLIEEKDVLVDGITGKMIVRAYLYAKDKTRSNYSIVIVSNGETYEFSGISKDLDNPDKAIFDKVLSTVKFTSKGLNKFEEISNTSDWKTYSNPDSHYSIRYPATWTVDNLKLSSASSVKRLSYTTFKDEEELAYELRIEVSPMSELQNLEKNNDTEKCSDYRQNNLTLNSGKQINYAKCEYYNKYILEFSENDRLFVIYSNRGIINPPIVDNFLSTISLE